MTLPEDSPEHRAAPDRPSAGALEQARLLAGSSAAIRSVVRLHGGQHADTWRVLTAGPERAVVVRQFPPGDPAAAHEQRVLQALEGLDGLAPVLLAGDLDGGWSEAPTSLISWLDGRADITPADPETWATGLGHALATVHAFADERLAGLPRVFERATGPGDGMAGPLAPRIRSVWRQITAAPEVLTHSDYWSGNVVWRDGRLTGIVDWSGGARGPRGWDVSWCRLDLVLLFDERLADAFLAAYEDAAGQAMENIALWDGWALARAHDVVDSWTPNYAPLGRPDLTPEELRGRHSRWTARVAERG
jgi:aminoglycoside phosphotransferase (APT) family kinase protein